MNNKLLLSFSFFLLIFGYHNILKSQCITDENNVITFTFENKTYEIVKETKSWNDAKLCAMERRGYLVEINSQAEQEKIWEELGNAGLQDDSYSAVGDGGGASYIWIGATDKDVEGKWEWTGSGTPFWEGVADGAVVEGGYANWGKIDDGNGNWEQREPDNFGDRQNVAAIALTDWSNGTKGQWNDIDEVNELYFIIEKEPIVVPETFVVTTANATRITSTKATLNGEIINEDSLVIAEKGFMYKDADITNTEWTQVLIGEEVTTLSYLADNLTSNVTYIFYAFAKIEGETETRNGDTLQFTTRAQGSVVAISDSVGSILPESAMLYGTIEGEPAEGAKVGFEWKQVGSQNKLGVKEFIYSDTVAQFTHRITGLKPDKEYIMFFYVGDEKGDEYKFKTKTHTSYKVTTNDAEINNSEVKLSAIITQKGTHINPIYTFDYKPSDQEQWSTTGKAESEFVITLRKLESNKEYTFRAVVTTDTVKVYGEEKTFTSPTILGIFDVSENVELSVYPNPATSYVNIKIKALEETSELLLISIVGQIVKRYEIPFIGEQEEFVLSIPVNDLPRGLYYIKIGNAIRKIMVE